MSTANIHCPRPEHPRPQLRREDWLNLNGEWEFEMDPARCGLEAGWEKREHLSDSITLPFCPESQLSGVGYTDFIDGVWYRREIDIPSHWQGGHILLHFGAVDYHATVWVNGQKMGEHKGGYTPFTLDITEGVTDGKAVVTVYAADDIRSGKQPAGKQSPRLYSFGCNYTRTTGIWQTVWMEFVPALYIKGLRLTPCVDDQAIGVEVSFNRPAKGVTLSAQSRFEGTAMGEKSLTATGLYARFSLPLQELHLWDVGQGNLYDLTLTLSTGDRVESYFGMRSIDWDDNTLLLNGRPVFQRLVLDQGFYPDGIYTAPTADELRRDVERGIEMGFNGARMHEKVFEPLYLHYADKAGYLLWGEFPNWGMDISNVEALANMLPEWIEAVERDYNSPAVIGWCPFNETWDWAGRPQDGRTLLNVYRTTKAIDKTRPVIDTSGNYHVESDIHDIHLYEQDPVKFAEKFAPMRRGEGVLNLYPDRQPTVSGIGFVSEYGGIWWDPADSGGWGYGSRPQTEQEFLERYEKLTVELLTNPYMAAFCYTQLYDIEQEVNGLYTYDRQPKFDPALIREINTRSAAIEED